MPIIQDYLLTIDSDGDAAANIAAETSKKLQSKSTTLIDVVQSLGEYINDENPSIRAKASSYLTAVISALPPRFLSRQQIQVLCQFFCDRVEDGEGMAGLEGLKACMKLDRFGNDMVTMTARAIFANFQDLQTRPQSQRYEILQVVNSLMEFHRKALKEMGHESLVGIVDLVSGEKDPRNLMLVFSMLRVIMVEWDITGHAETLFDAVFCYFPITFRPPPNNPYLITAQDLKDRVRDCISCNSEFAPYAFPGLLEKLDSSSSNVKKDVLQTFKACSLSYDHITMSRYSVTLWDSLKYEILNAQEDELAEEALQALRAIAQGLSEPGSTAPTSRLAQYVRPAMKECNELLQEPQQKQAKQAGSIVHSLAAASESAYFLVIKAVLAPLLTVYQDTEGHAKQRPLLEVMSSLFESAIEVFGSWNSSNPIASLENPLDPFRDRLQELFGQALMSTVKEEVSFRLTALDGLLHLANIRGFLQENEIGLIVQYLNEIVLVEESYSRDELKQKAVQGLAEISKSKPRLISDITFPKFMAKLPESDARESQYLSTLEGLAQISVERELFDTLIRRLLNRLDVILGASSSPAYPRAILCTILYVFQREEIKKDPNLDMYYEKIVVSLIRRATLPVLEGNSLTTLNDASVLDVLGCLAALVVRSLPKEKQSEVSSHIYELYSPMEGYTEKDYVSRQLAQPQAQTIILSTYLLTAIPRDLYPPESVTDKSSTLADIFSILESAVIKQPDTVLPASTLAIHRQLALIANKFTDPKLAQRTMQTLESTIGLLSSATTTYSRLPEIRLTFHLSRAFLSRLVPQTPEILNNLLALVSHSDESISKTSAHGFALLLAPDPVLTSQNGFAVRLLFKQKVFATLVPEIAKRCREAELPFHKANLLISLSGLLAHTPHQVILPELGTLLPLLLQSLDVEVEDANHAVKNATLETLTLVVRETPSAIDESGHTTSLVNRLLKTALYKPPLPRPPPVAPLSSTKKDPKFGTTSLTDQVSSPFSSPPVSSSPISSLPPQTRLLSLQLLTLFPTHLNQTSLLPLKARVLRQLSLCTDDPKRNVRKAAVDCRKVWFGMDEPDEDD